MPHIIERLASSLGQKDETPNIALAKQIVVEKNTLAIQVLIDNLYHKQKAIQSDCIKVLYEVGEKAPELISDYLHEFTNLLLHKNNRLQWGGMAAIHSITLNKPAAVYEHLPQIIKAANNGSIITKDHAVGVLLKLCTLDTYKDEAFYELLKQLKECPTNQLPLYAEHAAPIVSQLQKNNFTNILSNRILEIEQASKKKRIEKVLKSFEKKTNKVRLRKKSA